MARIQRPTIALTEKAPGAAPTRVFGRYSYGVLPDLVLSWTDGLQRMTGVHKANVPEHTDG